MLLVQMGLSGFPGEAGAWHWMHFGSKVSHDVQPLVPVEASLQYPCTTVFQLQLFPLAMHHAPPRDVLRQYPVSHFKQPGPPPSAAPHSMQFLSMVVHGVQPLDPSANRSITPSSSSPPSSSAAASPSPSTSSRSSGSLQNHPFEPYGYPHEAPFGTQ